MPYSFLRDKILEGNISFQFAVADQSQLVNK